METPIGYTGSRSGLKTASRVRFFALSFPQIPEYPDTHISRDEGFGPVNRDPSAAPMRYTCSTHPL